MPKAVLSALDLKNGATTKTSSAGALIQPTQCIPSKYKTDDWIALNIDFREWEGLKQIKRTSPRLLKYYNVSAGIIDKTDYVPDEDNDMSELIENLEQGHDKMLDLQFYPIIPTIIDSFRTEFSKRASKLLFTCTDDQSTNEMDQDKTSKLEQILLADLQYKTSQKLQTSGADMNPKQVQQQLQPDVLKQLPELQNFYSTSYRNIYAEWAQHQKSVDDERFHINELEDWGFGDSLKVDREFWHLKMKETDYEVELWNPLTTAFGKSPGTRWASNYSWIVNFDIMTVPDIVDKLGYMLDDEQMLSLEAMYPIKALGYLADMPNDGSYYDTTKSYDWNTQGPSLAARQLMSRRDFSRQKGDIILDLLIKDHDELESQHLMQYLRVSTCYWKTQRKYGHLTKIAPGIPMPIQDIIDEGYVITDKPIYDTSVYKTKSKRNLVFGEHIDYFWANEVWGGYKIGPNRPSWFGMNNVSTFQPLYVGLNGGKPGRIPFQFKGDDNIWGVKLPVEGCVFSERNTVSVPMVARLLPYQVGFNMVNNQILDLIIDEAGSTLFIDQNTIPKHSMGEDWGDNNYAKFWTTVKRYGIGVTDHSTENSRGVGGPAGIPHIADLSQTNRILGRIKYAEHFKHEAFASIGFNEQRLGQDINHEQTAKGYEEALNKSYDITEMYFTQHCDWLMPRFHQMRTELAQYYNCNNPSIVLQYTSDSNVKQCFRMDGTGLLLRDINVKGVTKINARRIMDQVKQKMMVDNTTGTGPADYTRILKAENLAELDHVVNGIEQRVERERQDKMDQENQQHQAELEQEAKLKAQEWEQKDHLQDMINQKDIYVAEITAASRAATAKPPQEGEDAYQDGLDKIQAQSNFREEMDLKKESHYTKTALDKEKLGIQRQKVHSEDKRTAEALSVARINAAKKAKEAKRK